MAIGPLNLAELQIARPVVDKEGRATPEFLRYINTTIRSIKSSVNEIAKVQNDLAEQLALIQEQQEQILGVRRSDAISASSTEPLAVLTQADNGTAVDVTMIAHTRRYGDSSSVQVSQDVVTVPYATTLSFYYDDPDLEGGAVDLQSTTDFAMGQANYVAGRHAVGTITTIAAGATPPPAEGGMNPPGYRERQPRLGPENEQ